jgi:hypothetical protein
VDKLPQLKLSDEVSLVDVITNRNKLNDIVEYLNKMVDTPHIKDKDGS